MAILVIKHLVDPPRNEFDRRGWHWWHGVTWSQLWLGPTDVEYSAASWIDYQGDLRRETVKTLHPPLDGRWHFTV